jgi:hypothetical protein
MELWQQANKNMPENQPHELYLYICKYALESDCQLFIPTADSLFHGFFVHSLQDDLLKMM